MISDFFPLFTFLIRIHSIIQSFEIELIAFKQIFTGLFESIIEKMNISKIIIFLLALILIQTSAHILIEIDPEDFEQVSDFFENIIINNRIQQHPINSKRSLMRIVKKTASGLIQMLCVMITLVASNILTTKISELNTQQAYENEFFERNVTNNTILKKCNQNDFGCNRNLCWRTCDVENDERTKKWCYTTANAINRKFQNCSHSFDCSPCWDCLNKEQCRK